MNKKRTERSDDSEDLRNGWSLGLIDKHKPSNMNSNLSRALWAIKRARKQLPTLRGGSPYTFFTPEVPPFRKLANI